MTSLPRVVAVNIVWSKWDGPCVQTPGLAVVGGIHARATQIRLAAATLVVACATTNKASFKREMKISRATKRRKARIPCEYHNAAWPFVHLSPVTLEQALPLSLTLTTWSIEFRGRGLTIIPCPDAKVTTQSATNSVNGDTMPCASCSGSDHNAILKA